jgi:hypothetical protein
VAATLVQLVLMGVQVQSLCERYLLDGTELENGVCHHDSMRDG